MREMKDTGINWLNIIPKNWDYRRLKNILKERKENNDPVKTDNILSLTNDRGVIPYSEKGDHGNKAKDDLRGYKIAYPNDIVMNSMNVVIGSVGLSKYYGCVSPVYYMLYSDKYDIRYYNYIFQSKVFQNELKGLGNGILEIRMRIPMEKMNNVIMPIPPIDEQRKIANFLEKKINEIDIIIEKTKKTIDDYKKYKQSIITEVVNKGLKDNIEIKDTNNKWIRNIPSTWNIQKLKTFIDIPVVDGPHESPELFDEGIPYISATAIENGKINFDLMRGYISEEYCNKCDIRYKPKINDILVIKLGATTGQVAMVNTDKRFNIWVPLAAVRCSKSVIPRFIYYSFQSSSTIRQMELMWTFGTQQTLGVKTIEQLMFALPSKTEQELIVKYLDKKCAEIDNLILKKENIIEELEQYKKSLIYEYVTGKKEVI